MTKRPPVFLACLVCILLGLTVGLADTRELIRYPVERLREFEKLPQPLSLLWVEQLRGPKATLEDLEQPFIALTVVLLLGALYALGATLNPHFRLLKPPDERVGRGGMAHLDMPRLWRAGAAAAVSLWLIGLLGPLSAATGRSTQLLWGGLPAWTGLLPDAAALLVLSVGLCLGLSLLWGPGGLATRERHVSRSEGWLWAVLFGVAAYPGFVALYGGRAWVKLAHQAFTLADPSGWHLLIGLSLALPVVGLLYLAVAAALCRPRPVSGSRLPVLGLGALLFLGIGYGATLGGRSVLASLDVGRTRLRDRLSLQPSDLRRYALIAGPRGQLYPTSPADGTDDGTDDRIACRWETQEAVEKYLRARRFRTQLAFRGFVHLFDCAALDWWSERTLEVTMLMLEKAPSPVAAELLLEKLSNCPTTPEFRQYLDRLADPKQFRWPQPDGARWLAASYLRFGELERAQKFIPEAKFQPEEVRQLVGGISPLASGTVQGRLMLDGKPKKSIRLGLVRGRRWTGMVGAVRPYEWRHVITSAHTDEQGRFEFRNIPEGLYWLVMTGDRIGTDLGMPELTPFPGPIRLDRYHPVRSLPDLNLHHVRPIRAPREGPGTSTTTDAGGRTGTRNTRRAA